MDDGRDDAGRRDRIDFLAWFAKTSENSRMIEDGLTGEELDRLVRSSPACEARWITALRAWVPERFRADLMAPVVMELVELATTDEAVPDERRAELVMRLRDIAARLRRRLRTD